MVCLNCFTVFLSSCRVVEDLLSKTRSDIGSLYKLREIVCQLDVIVSFAQVSSAGGFCRPTFGNELVIRSGRHPILDHFSPNALVSNDTVSQCRRQPLVQFRVTLP